MDKQKQYKKAYYERHKESILRKQQQKKREPRAEPPTFRVEHKTVVLDFS